MNLMNNGLEFERMDNGLEINRMYNGLEINRMDSGLEINRMDNGLEINTMNMVYHWEKETDHGDTHIRPISFPLLWLWNKLQITRLEKSEFTHLLLLKLVVDELNEYFKK